jgi:hypothetical protein
VIPQIKTILLNQYIGAIAIGYLVGRGFEAFFAGIMPALNTMLTEAFRGRTYIGQEPWIVARVSLVSNLLLTGLYFAAAFFMASWLYADTKQEIPQDVG